MNVVVREGVAQRRAGYLQLGQTLDGAVVGITEFGQVGVTPSLMVLTTNRQYRFASGAFSIVAVSTVNKTFSIATNQTSIFVVGVRFVVSGSTGNDGTYTVVQSTFAGGNTVITVSEVIPSAVADGSISVGAFIDITKRKVTTAAINLITLNTAPTDDVIRVTGDITAHAVAGVKIIVFGSTDNNRIYTVVSSSFAAGNTSITVDEEVTSATADGSIEVVTRNTITAVDAVGPDYSIGVSGDHAAAYTTGVKFYIIGSTGNDGYYTVKAPGATFGGGTTTIPTVEVIFSATADGRAEATDPLTTTETDVIDFLSVVDAPIGARLLMTNGVNNPRVWSGLLTENFYRWAPVYSGFVTNKTFGMFFEHLFMGGIVSSVNEPQVIAWSDSGTFNNFEDGASGVQLLHQLIGGIKALVPLGDRLVIYSLDAIAVGIFVGLPAVFAFEIVIPVGTRLVSPKSIISINIGHVYASEENFYVFDGTRGLRVVSDLIRTDYKAVKDQDKLHRVTAVNDHSKRTVYFAIPDLEGGTTVYSVEYDIFNLDSLVWGKERYAHIPRSFGFFTNSSVVTWADTVQEASLFPSGVPWSEELAVWGSEGDQVDFPVRTFGSNNGKVFIVTEGVLTDAGTTALGLYETIDFTVPEPFLSQFGRWGEVEFEAGGGTITVKVSTDLGAVFETIGTAVINGTFTTVRMPIDKHSRTLRVRFEFNADFKLRWVKVWVRPEAAQ